MLNIHWLAVHLAPASFADGVGVVVATLAPRGIVSYNALLTPSRSVRRTYHTSCSIAITSHTPPSFRLDLIAQIAAEIVSVNGSENRLS